MHGGDESGGCTRAARADVEVSEVPDMFEHAGEFFDLSLAPLG